MHANLGVRSTDGFVKDLLNTFIAGHVRSLLSQVSKVTIAVIVKLTAAILYPQVGRQRRALSIDEKGYGTEHPRVVTHLNSLALLL